MTMGSEKAIETTEDAFLDGRVRVLQPRKGYRAAIDPVFLAAAVDLPEGARVLDAGAGVGTASLCLAARRPDLRIAALELQPELAGLARRNVELNKASGITVIEGSLHDADGAVPYDAVMTNPPYWRLAETRPSPDPIKRTATVEDAHGLTGWIAACARRLGPSGKIYMVHSATRVDDIADAALGCGFGSVSVFPLWSKAGAAAKRVIVMLSVSVEPVRTGMQGLVLHDDAGTYTVPAQNILRGAAPLVFTPMG